MRQPLIKEINKSCRHEVIEGNKKYDQRYGFLHIPKTGGSSMMRFFDEHHQRISAMPVPLFHTWTMELVLDYFPAMKLVFTIRDPLERTISGYQSRLRMGTPEYYVPWREKEAIAFCMYPSVEQFLDALLDDSDYHQSATTYLLNSVMAVAWNYEHYFSSPEYIKDHHTSIGPISETANLNQYLAYLIDADIIRLTPGSASHTILASLQQAHASKASSRSFLAHYTQTEIARMRSRLEGEYAIYNTLLDYCLQ